MAHLVPSEFPHESDTNVWAENTFFNACRDQLSDEWTVLYSQRFIGKRPSLGQRQGQGEVDFVLLHKTFGVIVVEVKGGQIDIVDGQWFSENKEGRHKIKNPFVQAEEGAQAIFEVLKNIVNDVRTTNSTHHCVVFPAVSKKSIGAISTYGPRQIIILREDLKELTSKIEQVAVHWDQKPRWNDADFKKIRSGLLPSTKTPGVSYVQYVNILKELDLLTESQIRTIRQITNNPGTTVITGGAGTGKTVLGMYRAQQLALEGRDVLFLCANGSLAQHLRNEVENTGKDLPQNLTVDAMSAYLSTIGRAGTRGPEFEKRKQELPSRDDRYLDAVQRLNLEATIDCLIVDEAQDITKDELSLVELLVRPAERGGSIIILGDPNQQLALRRSESALGQIDSSECLLLDVNCRNTYEIAQIAHSFTQQLISTLETVSGIKVRKSKIRDRKSVV